MQLLNNEQFKVLTTGVIGTALVNLNSTISANLPTPAEIKAVLDLVSTIVISALTIYQIVKKSKKTKSNG